MRIPFQFFHILYAGVFRRGAIERTPLAYLPGCYNLHTVHGRLATTPGTILYYLLFKFHLCASIIAYCRDTMLRGTSAYCLSGYLPVFVRFLYSLQHDALVHEVGKIEPRPVKILSILAT